METNFVTVVCLAFFVVFCSVTAKHRDFVNKIPERDVLWTVTSGTNIACMVKCLQRNICFSVQLLPNGTCRGLRGKLVKNSISHNYSQIGYIYVTDKGTTSEKETASAQPRTKSSTIACDSPPEYPNAVVDNTTGNGYVKTARYSCKPGLDSCSETITTCLATETWDTDIVKCVQNTSGPHKSSFQRTIPRGPKKSLSVTIEGVFTGKKMRIVFLRKKDVLLYMTCEPKITSFGAKIKGKWIKILERAPIIVLYTPFRLRIDLNGTYYLVYENDALQNKIKEKKLWVRPSKLGIQWDVCLTNVTISR